MNPRVKTATTTVALAAILGTAWYQSRVLATERFRLASLRQQVEAVASVSPAVASSAASGRAGGASLPPSAKSLPEVVLDADRLQFIHDMAAKEAPNLRERSEDAMLAIGAMSNAEFRRYIKAVKASPELSEAERNDHCKFALSALIDRRPADGLTLYTESEEWAKLGIESRSVSSALRRWALEDLPGSLAWLRETISERPEMVGDEARHGMISSAARTDPAQALSLIGEFEIGHPSNSTQTVIGVADTPEKRLKALQALRVYLPTIKDRGERNDAGDYAIAVLGRLLAKDGVEAGIKWAESAGLTASEISSLGSDIGDEVRPGDESQWIEWFDRKLEDKYCGRPIRHVMGYWARRNHKAAAAWLNNAPEGAAKNAAIARFADEVTGIEPESAAQWAETLPPGELRTSTLTDVYCSWPKNTEASRAAAQAFALKNGLRK
jgi:hypothetical protein